MVEAMGTTEQGTSVSQAVYGLEHLGVPCRRHWVKTLSDVHAPAILWVKLGGLDHAIALLSYDGHRADVIDPCRGHRHLTDAEFASYQWRGGALEVDVASPEP
jgi:ABC-type bacteriocin/lantibiotic exporter with double-glycine peptidase domain